LKATQYKHINDVSFGYYRRKMFIFIGVIKILNWTNLSLYLLYEIETFLKVSSISFTHKTEQSKKKEIRSHITPKF